MSLYVAARTQEEAEAVVEGTADAYALLMQQIGKSLRDLY
jgi:hypothetical protein